MPIIPMIQTLADGSITVSHDEHSGDIAVADIRFNKHPDGTPNPDVIILICPVCGATSEHPISGGCDAKRIQLLFARVYRRRAAALGIPAGAARTWPGIKAIIRNRIAAREGIERWKLEDLATEDDSIEDPLPPEPPAKVIPIPA